MELRHLEYFVAVAEERHFTRAAQRLIVSQSGLSASVRTLERELGAQLFVRSTRSVELTEPGRALLEEAYRTLASVRAAKEAVAAVQGLLRGTLAVGTEQCVAVVDVPALLARFRSEHPQVEIRLRQAASATLVDSVAAGHLDLAFLALGHTAPDGVRLRPLAHEPMVVLCHPEHPLADASEVGWEALAGEHFVDFPPDWGVRVLTDRSFAAARTERRVTLEVNDVHTLISLVRQGLGIAMVPRPISRKKAAVGLSTLRVVGPPEPIWQVSIALPAGEPIAPAAQMLCSYLRDGAEPTPAGVGATPGAAATVPAGPGPG